MRQPLLYALLGAAALAVLSGCATLSREECLRGDWYQIGVSDGQAGHEMARLDDHRRACRDTPAMIDETAYRAGRDEGLVTFCTPVSGYRVGREGRAAPAVCPAATATGFLHGHVLGEQVHRAERDLSDAERRLRSLETALEDKREDIEALRASIQTADASEDVSGPRQTLRRLRREADDLRADIRSAQFNVDIAREALRDTRARTSLQLQAISAR